MNRSALEEYAKAVTRRHFFRGCGVGVGAMALGSLLAGDSPAAPTVENPLAPRSPHAVPKAKSVIYLHMAGSPSQLELFDYKPILQKFDGQTCPQEYLEGKRFAFIKPEAGPTMLGPRFSFRQHGRSGTWADISKSGCTVPGTWPLPPPQGEAVPRWLGIPRFTQPHLDARLQPRHSGGGDRRAGPFLTTSMMHLGRRVP